MPQPRFIVCATRNDDGSIFSVRVQGTGQKWEQMTKRQVIEAIEKNDEFWTAYQKDGTWEPGEEVQAVPENAPTYLRTRGNPRLEDNLGELPECPLPTPQPDGTIDGFIKSGT